MSVSYQAIIEKMIKELQSIDAKTSTDQMKAKMYSVQSMATLITGSDYHASYDGKQSTSNVSISDQPENFSIEEAEAKVMGMWPKSKKQQQIEQGKRLDEDDANGDSIFDFLATEKRRNEHESITADWCNKRLYRGCTWCIRSARTGR